MHVVRSPRLPLPYLCAASNKNWLKPFIKYFRFYPHSNTYLCCFPSGHLSGNLGPVPSSQEVPGGPRKGGDDIEREVGIGKCVPVDSCDNT